MSIKTRPNNAKYSKNYDAIFGNMKAGRVEVVTDEIAAVEANQWISVDDRLPDEVGVYLTYWTDDSMESFSFDILDYGAGWARPLGKDLITHWMHLPAPPKQAGDL